MKGQLLVEAVVLCIVFFVLIFLFVFQDRRGGLQWYPKKVQEEAVRRGVITRARLDIQNKLSKMLMIVVSAAVILVSVFTINQVCIWGEAFTQIYFLCFVMNLFDGIVVDYLWVSRTKYWIIPELSDLEIPKSLGHLIKERIIMCIIYIPLAALFACAVWI